MTRRLYIDWLRGVAVLLMIFWHVIDAWTVEYGRDTIAFETIRFLAGWVAPLFLFLAGVSLPLAARSKMQRGATIREAGWALQIRGWQVFALAHLFRLQSFLLNPNGSWNGLLKPDILNVLGLGMVAASFCWSRAPQSVKGLASWLLAPAVVIVALLTPWARLWWWPTLLHPRLEAYLRPVGNYGVFSVFPSLAYILAGTFLGALIVDRDERALFPRLARIGALLVAAGVGLTGVLWLWSPTPGWFGPAIVFLWRTGGMTLALIGVRAVLANRELRPSSPMVVFGQTSLFVYWVHVELAYGVFSYPLHHALTLGWSLLGVVVVSAFMLFCAIRWNRRSRPLLLIPRHLAA